MLYTTDIHKECIKYASMQRVVILLIFYGGVVAEMSDLQQTTGLKRHKVGLLAIVGTIYSLTAAGAYGIEDMVPAAGPGLCMVMLVVIPLVWAYPQAFVCAEMGSAIPAEGGPYKWVQETCGEFWGFQMGWWRTIGGYFNTVTYVVLAAGYMTSAFGLSATQEYAVKIAFIVIFTIINLRGIKDVAIVNTVISISILVSFAIVAVLGFAHYNQSPVEPFIPEGQTLIQSIGNALAIGMWMYGGMEAMSIMSEELERPQLIPKALMIAIPLIILTYMIPTMAGLSSLGDWQEWGSEGVSYQDVAAYGGPIFYGFFLIVAVLSNVSLFNGYIASTSRGFFVMAADNLCPNFLVKCDKKRGVPYVGVLTVAIVGFFLCTFDFSSLVVGTVMMSIFASSLTQISGIIRRVRKTHPDGPFKLKVSDALFVAYSAVPFLVGFIAIYLGGTHDFIYSICGIMSGPVIYIVLKLMKGGLTKINPKRYPTNPKTKLAPGDLSRIGIILVMWAVLGVLAVLWFPSFDGAANYDPGVFDNYMLAIKCIIGIGGAIGIILMILGKKKDPAKLFWCDTESVEK